MKTNNLVFISAILIALNLGYAIDIHVNTEVKYQKIAGIGAHLYNWSGYTKEYYQTESLIEDYITDLGNSMVRVELHPNLCLDSITSLTSMENYENYKMNLEKDNVHAVFTALKNLVEKNPDLKVIGTVWSPPGWMKTNGKSCCGGRLKPEFYPYFARYMNQYYQFLKDRYGVTLYAMSPQNELLFSQSYNSCVYSGNEYHQMVKALGSHLSAKNNIVKIFGSEDMTHFQHRVVDYISRIKEDPEAKDFLDIVATHGYTDGVVSGGGTPEENMELYTRLKDFNVDFWMTETSGEGHQWEDGLSFNSNGSPAEGALNGLGAKMHTAFVYGFVSGWTYWAFSDPETYGRYSFGSGAEDKKYRVHKHYSKYIKPGAYRVAASPDGENDVWVSAYHHEQNKRLTLVLLNLSREPREISVRMAFGSAASSFEAYRTSETENFSKLTNIGVNSTSRTASFSIPGRSMMTLVGNILPENQGNEPEPPTINLSTPTFNSNTAIPVTLTIDRDFGYYSLDGGNTYNRIDNLYDQGKVSFPILESSTLKYYAEEGGISTPIYSKDFTINIQRNVVYQQGQSGTVEIEAEGYFSKESGKGEHSQYTWEMKEGPLSSLGMQALPDLDEMDAGENGPVLNYKINFSQDGKHYLWTRGSGPSSTAGGNHWNNSTIYYSLNDEFQDSQRHKFNLDENGFSNQNILPHGYMKWEKSTINIPSTGVHTLNIGMRADGVRFDKFVITSDSGFAPTSYLKPAAKPQNFRVTSFNLDSIQVQWEPGERAFGYEVYYRKQGQDWSRKQRREVDTTFATFHDFDGEAFLAGQTYEFRIQSVHPQGYSGSTDSIRAVIPEAGFGGFLGLENANMKGYPIPSDGEFVNEGYKWTFTRTSSDVKSLGSTIGQFDRACVMYGDGSSLKSSTIPGGIGSLGFTIGRHGWPSGGQFVVKVNGKEVAKTHKLDWSTDKPFRYDFPGINIKGEINLEILNITPADGNNSRGVIDDIAWTAYEGGRVPDSPENISAQSGNQGVRIKWSPSPGANKYRIFRAGKYPEQIYEIGETGSQIEYFDVSAKSGMQTYYVTALNDNGESSFSDSVSTHVMNGLRAWYFSDEELKGYRFDRIDPRIDLSWNSSQADSAFEPDGFSVRWEGMLNTPGKKIYLFTLDAPGGVRFWVEDSLLIDSWGNENSTQWSDSIKLSGSVPIRIEYAASGVNPGVRLWWEHHPDWGGSWSEKEIIPQDSFRAAAGGYETSPIHPTRPIASIHKLSLSTGLNGLTLEVPENQAYWFTVYNAKGSPLLSGSGKRGGVRVVPLQPLSAGLYYVRLQTRKQSLSQQIYWLD